MSYVQQICEGYNKKTLLGNWNQERQYPEQPFRVEQQKQARSKDQGITCFDNTGFQRALPRLSRRTKWETTTRIILDDGVKQLTTVMKQDYPNGQHQYAVKNMSRPIDKNSDAVKTTTLHPHSELKVNQKQYKLLDQQAVNELNNQRNVKNFGSDFASTLIQHPKQQKFTNYQSNYKGSFKANFQTRNKAFSQMAMKSTHAGNFNPNQEQTVRPITNMTGELKKQSGDFKEMTQVQRSWVPPRDKSITYSMGKTANDFKKANIPTNDIQTSLNMNIGVQNIHPKDINDNYFRHVRQDVTIRHNNTFCARP